MAPPVGHLALGGPEAVWGTASDKEVTRHAAEGAGGHVQCLLSYWSIHFECIQDRGCLNCVCPAEPNGHLAGVLLKVVEDMPTGSKADLSMFLAPLMNRRETRAL